MKSNNTFENLISDDHFVSWVKSPNDLDEIYWSDWKEKHPDRIADFEEAIEFVHLMSIKERRFSDTQIQRIKEGIDSRLGIEYDARQTYEPTVFSYLKWVASFLLVGFSVLFIYLLAHNSDLIPNGDHRKVMTQLGQKSSLILEDGTKIWLNGGSSLTFPNSFDRSIRKVSLEGEAFFEVAHDSARPFIVETSNLAIKVLGTSFNVRSYPEDGLIETALLEGKVQLDYGNRHQQLIYLAPNQQAVYSKKARTLNVAVADVDKISAWRTGTLFFDNETVDKMADRLERLYGADIEVLTGGNCRISAKIENESLDEFLELLKLTSKVEFERTGNHVLLKINCK